MMRLFLLSLLFTCSDAFVVRPSALTTLTTTATSHSQRAAAKGFGAPQPKKERSEGQIKREQEASKYDEIAAAGGQQYNVFVRQFGSDDTTWLPCGSIAVPRNAQVADAIYANEGALKAAIVRTYPKLTGMEQEMEFGFNLKVYPDDPIEVARKGVTRMPACPLAIGFRMY
jgi:hypothetical protein